MEPNLAAEERKRRSNRRWKIKGDRLRKSMTKLRA
jgi:hypothetical protein